MRSGFLQDSMPPWIQPYVSVTKNLITQDASCASHLACGQRRLLGYGAAADPLENPVANALRESVKLESSAADAVCQ
jgi:hypothetical protein